MPKCVPRAAAVDEVVVTMGLQVPAAAVLQGFLEAELGEQGRDVGQQGEVAFV
jgi:hypothetical protein